MNTAKKGANLERYIRQLLEADGWSVIRGAASKGEALGRKADHIQGVDGMKKSKAPKILDKIVDTVLRYKPKKKAKKKHGKR